MKSLIMFRLVEKKIDRDWYCISCEKKVSTFKLKDIYCKHLIPSYFIRVNPHNARICKDCVARSIREGTD